MARSIRHKIKRSIVRTFGATPFLPWCQSTTSSKAHPSRVQRRRRWSRQTAPSWPGMPRAGPATGAALGQSCPSTPGTPGHRKRGKSRLGKQDRRQKHGLERLVQTFTFESDRPCKAVVLEWGSTDLSGSLRPS